MPDILFCALLIALCAHRAGFEALLADGDTGWHIRTGQFVLAKHKAPAVDMFSFTRAGQPWFAWEWLSDVVFALAFGWGGIGAVAALTATVLCGSAVVLLAWLLRRESGLWVAAGVTLAVFSASSVHYLARPHMFSILLYTVCLWLLDEDRRRLKTPGAPETRGYPGALGWRPSRRVWLLIPLSALWVNLHGGFVALLAVLALAAAVSFFQRNWRMARRYGLLGNLCLAATFANPYGWHLHIHIAQYLNAPWILNQVQEFQSPSIRSEGMVVFAILLLAGSALASRAFGRRQWFEGALVLVWGFAALRSARHIPFYAISAAPLLASELAGAWKWAVERVSLRSALCVFWNLGQELGRSRSVSLWLIFAVAGALAAAPHGLGFPDHRFPVEAVERAREWLAPADGMPRLLTSDQWADYVIFRLYPRQRVFFDGRSDFYGPALSADYRALMEAGPNWQELMDRYRFQAALLPHTWPLSSFLGREPGWREVYQDSVAVLYVREEQLK